VCAALAVCRFASIASHADAAVHSAATVDTSPIVTPFGRDGGTMLPLRVTIDASVAVTVSAPRRTTPSSMRLSPDTLDGLRTLAAAEGSATMPSRQVGRGLPAVGGWFVSIRTGGTLKAVYVRDGRNRAFAPLYAVLSGAGGPADLRAPGRSAPDSCQPHAADGPPPPLGHDCHAAVRNSHP